MGRSNQKTTTKALRSDPDETAVLLEGMPLGQAVFAQDMDTVASFIRDTILTKGASFQEVSMEKTLGEAFTGGRSTPVYYVQGQVHRPGNDVIKHRSFCVKLVILPGDDQDALVHHKRESYAVERRFYDCAASKIRSANLTIPKLLASDRDGSRSWPSMCFLMNDLRTQFPRHPDFLSRLDVQRALKWLAHFHACFWGDHGPTASWRKQLWEHGGFSTKDKRMTNVASNWVATVRWLQSKHPESVTEHTRGLGQRIQAASGPIANFLSQQARGPRSTLIHGDFKAANLFFSEGDDDVGESSAESVAAVDFQYSGAGVGPEDVAYLLFPDARGHFFDHEIEVLKIYHEELIEQLILQAKGGPSSMPWDSFLSYYQLARINLIRYWIGRGWVASTEGDAILVTKVQDTMLLLDGGCILRDEEAYAQALVGLSL